MTETLQRWWPGPLACERLAWDSAVAARDAARRVCTARGQGSQIDTDPALVAASFAAIDHLRVDGRAAQPWASRSGFFRTVDGWLRTHANYLHHAQAVDRALGATDRDSMMRVLAGMTALDAESCIVDAGGVAAAVRTPQQWAGHPHQIASAREAWTATEVTGERGLLRPGGHRPLEGVRVLDLTRVVAGPMATQLLGCLGAEVLRIDPPDRPELVEHHLAAGMGKRCASLDLAVQREEMERLLEDADVVVLGYRPGALDRYGLAPRDLVARFPSLVVASLSAWGETGPWSRRRGFDSIVQAASGLAVACQEPAGNPSTEGGVRPGALPVQALDHSTGLHLAARVLKMLAEGRSGIVRANLLGAARALVALPALDLHDAVTLPVRTVEVKSSGSTVRTVPPVLTLDGRMLTAPIGDLRAARPRWT